MGLRPGHCYRDTTNKPSYTRMAVRVHKRNYIGAVPGLKIRQFNMGNPNKEFEYILDLISEEVVQVRDNSIESLRIAVNRYLNKKVGKDGYFLKLRIYPFQLLRENKQAQGAGADRVTKGMAHPFGKVIGRAARVRKGQIIMSLLIDKENIEIGKKAMNRAKSKMTCRGSVKVHTDVKSIGTKPRKVKEEVVEKKEEKVEAGAAATPGTEAGKEGTAGKTEEKKAPEKGKR